MVNWYIRVSRKAFKMTNSAITGVLCNKMYCYRKCERKMNP